MEQINTHLPQAPEILVTRDYAMFRRLEGNRHIKLDHVKRLVQSFKDYPHMRPAKPVLLNEKNEIVDGQHRIEASERLGVEIYYMIVPGLTIVDARILNALQNTWNFIDYAESYGSDKDEKYDSYRRYLKIHSEYAIPPRTLFYYTRKDEDGSKNAELFKRGVFLMRIEDEIYTDLEKLSDFAPFNPYWQEQAFSLAVLHLLKQDGYDHGYMLERLKGKNMYKQHDAFSYIRDLEIIYNSGNRKYVKFL